MLLAHLSDSHLRSDALAGAPAATLHLALGRILALEPRPDCVVITGDLVEYGQRAAYAQLRELIARFPLPLHLVVGNHDDPGAVRETFAGTVALGGGAETHYVVDHPALSVAVLDSRQPGGPSGLVGERQLHWLDRVLAERAAASVFVGVHHPPVPVGIPFLDAMGLADADALGAVLGRHRNVVRVLAGHVHRAVSAPFAGTQVSIAPSTHRQSSLTLSADRQMGYLAEPPAFLLHVGTGAGVATHTLPITEAGALIGAF
ncbi:phosphodiesterase [Nocardia asteroides]|uniref:phosphodiesterase n=1 Tax=Nocardia asteroides TaxID=1824 RepID=UPI001E47331D|nr:phosphodiesterase [Nocardia asteroides]UGT61721.1 phosphodiesterase [Nocardia asteroides]